ncbi:MAG: cytochrome c oxidase subunit II [Cyanobacteria bacterium P01_F01_bin.150]
MKNIPTPLLTLLAGIATTVISLWYGNNHGLLPVQASVQAPMVDDLFNVMVVVATALFIIVEGTIIYFAIRYRRRKGDDGDGIPIEGNIQLEIFWTAIPAIIVLALGFYSVDVFREMGGMAVGDHSMHMSSEASQSEGTLVAQAPDAASQGLGRTATDVPDAPLIAHADMKHDEDLDQESVPQFGFGAAPRADGKTADVIVNVKGMQYAWLFNYPDGGMMLGELHIPVNKDIQLNIEAQDVLHSFWVPAFRLKQDAIPGKLTELRFMANRPGSYDIVCAELCGGYHGSMRSQVFVHEQDDFDQWLETSRIAQAPSSDEQKTEALAVATNDHLPVSTTAMTKSEYLTPYGEEMGIDPDHLPHHS